MTSVHGYSTYQDLIQAYDLADLRQVPERSARATYDPSTVTGWLQRNGFRRMLYLLETAQMLHLAGQPQFGMTLLACSDEDMEPSLSEADLMQLDRNDARRLVNAHLLPRIIHLDTLQRRRVLVLDSRQPSCGLTMTHNAGQVTVRATRCDLVSQVRHEIPLSNGIIYVMNNFYRPLTV